VPQYLLSVWSDEPYDDDQDLSAPDAARQMAQTDEVTAEMQDALDGLADERTVPIVG